MSTHTIYDMVIENAVIATMDGDGLGLIPAGHIAVRGGHIAAVDDGPCDAQAIERIDAQGRLITPGLIDCHTHLVYGGDRAGEFEMRLNGASYEDISKAGGGINSTVRATRAASQYDLYEAALARLNTLRREGVIALEIKSGYGLDTQTEAKMLRAATDLARDTDLHIQRTFLGAHAIPPEYKGRPDEYIDLVCNDMLPALVADHLVDAVDAFCENIAFTPEQTRKVFEAARAYGLPVKLHAEQLSNLGGASLAAQYEALSADHLEYLDEQGVRDMARHGTVAVILPGAYYTLRETKKPPIGLLRAHNVPMAIATDHNPGTSPALSLVLMMNMACTFFGMTPEEALIGVTKNAARALGIENRFGHLAHGRRADFVLWDVHSPAHLSYRFGHSPVHTLVYKGQISHP